MKGILVLLAAGWSFAAQATDGVIEINAATVAAAGGYPLTISQPGSYRLTSNLVQPSQHVPVIAVRANNVTIDLNGFTISGGNVCGPAAGGESCQQNSSVGMGIATIDASLNQVSTWSSTVVRNGIISGTGGSCIFLGGYNALVENVAVDNCGYFGIDANHGTVRHSRVANVSAAGIAANQVEDSYSRAAGDYGILGALIARNRVEGCRWGILASQGGVVVGNSVIGSISQAINGSASALATGNALSGNGTDSLGTVKSVPANSNLCNGSAC